MVVMATNGRPDLKQGPKLHDLSFASSVIEL